MQSNGAYYNFECCCYIAVVRWCGWMLILLYTIFFVAVCCSADADASDVCVLHDLLTHSFITFNWCSCFCWGFNSLARKRAGRVFIRTVCCYYVCTHHIEYTLDDEALLFYVCANRVQIYISLQPCLEEFQSILSENPKWKMGK